MAKTLFVLNDGKELSTEETIQHLLKEINKLKVQVRTQQMQIQNLNRFNHV